MTKLIIVITGSTQGIGFGLARSFLALGCPVVINGRSQAATKRALSALSTEFDPNFILGAAGDVTDPTAMQSLWNSSIEMFGRVDIWINNAGWSGEQGSLWQRPFEEVAQVISTNVLGTINGAQVAMRGMLSQGHGAIYNMEGMGSDGRKHAGLTTYGTSKYAIHYLTKSLAIEAKNTPVLVGSLRPGMVVTNMITDRYIDRPEEWERARKIFNIIADSVENVTPWLANKMVENQKNDVVLAYSSSWKLLWRLLQQPFVKRNLFPDSPTGS
jgi:NAD(P)-dependent dehydrogenase (short-subunit alcohol dehydrogenase family)